MKKDIKDIEDIKVFVNDFYNKVKIDALIGPVFLEKITGDWQPHLDKMYAFWNAALFGVAGFRGNPFAKHAPLPIEQQHFNRWLVLFGETIDTYFEGAIAEDAKNRAALMARVFVSRLGQMRGGPGKVIV
jgi:hemoglobin